MAYQKIIKEFDGIIGNTATKITRGSEVLCTVNATHKLNQARFAEMIRLLGMNDEAKDFIISAIKDKRVEVGDCPTEVKQFVDVFEQFVV